MTGTDVALKALWADGSPDLRQALARTEIDTLADTTHGTVNCLPEEERERREAIWKVVEHCTRSRRNGKALELLYRPTWAE